MIIINEPRIKRLKKNYSRLTCDISIDKKIKKIWFEVDTKYEKYLTHERADAFLIGILSFAMRNSHDIKCCAPVTEELLYKIETYLIPSLTKYNQNFYASKISTCIAPALKHANGVGTGCSCGVDSMHAIANYYNPDYPSLKLTHLCINSVGAFNECYSNYGIDKAKEERIQKAQEVAKALDIPLIVTNSNFYEEISQVHLYTHTYSSLFAIYALQKLWKVYFYGSSGYDFSSFSLKDNGTLDSGHYELLSLDCFSTSNLKIYSEGGAKTRFEKVNFIKNYPLAQKYLHVCTVKAYNCNLCPKCMRTILILYALNKLNNFVDVFNVDYFKKHKKEYLEWLYNEHINGVEMNEPTFQALIGDSTMKKIIDQNESEKLLVKQDSISNNLNDMGKYNIIKKKFKVFFSMLKTKGIKYTISYIIKKGSI